MKTWNVWALAGILILSSLGGGCGNRRTDLIENAPMISKRFTDGYGRSIELRNKPKRVISLAPHITETMFALGEGGSLVAKSNLCSYPEEAQDIPEVVIYPELDLATLVTYNPDLVIASAEYHQAGMAAFFDKYKIPIMFLKADSLAEVTNGIAMLGDIMDQNERAKGLNDSMTGQIARIADSTKGQIAYSTAMIVSLDPLRVVGGGSYQNDMLRKAGAKNAFMLNPERYPTITPADLIKAAPEYLLLAMDDDQAYAKLIELAPEIHLQLPAAQNKHVYLVEPDLIMTPGPRVVQGLAYLTRILHARINVDEIMRQPGN